MFPSFDLFGKEISMYAVMSVVGLLAGGFVFCRRVLRAKGNDTDTLVFLLVLGAGMLVGGHILFAITNLKYFPLLFEADSASEFFSVLGYIFGGMVFYGGLIGAYIFGLIYIKIRRLPMELYMDNGAFFAPIFHGFARVGCFFGGCCYGIESEFGFAAVGNTVTAIGDVRRFPVQLLESAINFIIAAVIFVFLKHGLLKGRVFYVYLSLYAFARFFLEFLRGDEIRGFIFGLSTSQFISILLEIFSLSMIAIYLFKKRRLEAQAD